MFKSKLIVISGGSSGIGRALAKKFASQGSNVIILARGLDRLKEAVEEIRRECKKSDQIVSYYQVDVTDYNKIVDIFSDLIGRYGIPDVYISSAGVSYSDYFRNISLEIFVENMNINYFGTLYPIKILLPYMLEEAKKGVRKDIVVISSLTAILPVYGYTAYSPSKAAVAKLIKDISYEYHPYIHFHIVYPPDTDTPQLHNENKTKPIETFMINEKAGVLKPEKVAEDIIKGLERDKREIYPGGQYLIRIVNKLFPQLIEKIILDTRKKVMKMRETEEGRKKIEEMLRKYRGED